MHQLTQEKAAIADDISELLFSLASVDRLALLSEISDRRQKLTALAKVINASPQECSRHIARLSESGFITKNSEGYYETTSLGRAVLTLLPTYRFLLTHREYFLAHDIQFLPKGFVGRVGELSSGETTDHFSSVLELIKKVISTGKQVSLISDRPVVVGPTIGPSFLSKEVSVRLISQPTIDRNLVAQMKAGLPNAEIATIPKITIAMAINETMAGVCFPDLAGKIDFGLGFTGTDPDFIGWCSDLFEHYWTRAKKLT
jgi:predicted transcriptional regulator